MKLRHHTHATPLQICKVTITNEKKNKGGFVNFYRKVTIHIAYFPPSIVPAFWFYSAIGGKPLLFNQ